MNTYIFDFDGTLVDSMPYWSEGMISIIKKANVAYPDDIIKIITPLGTIGTAKYLKEALGVSFEIDEILKMMNDYTLPKYRDIIPVKKGVYDYLKHLKQKGKSINMLTANSHNVMDACLKRVNIFDMFDNVWSTDDFNMSKSNPQIYKEALKRIGTTNEDTVFFDDNIVAVKTAKEAGLKTVGVYDETGCDFKDELEKISDLYINSFLETDKLKVFE